MTKESNQYQFEQRLEPPLRKQNSCFQVSLRTFGEGSNDSEPTQLFTYQVNRAAVRVYYYHTYRNPPEFCRIHLFI